MNELLRNVKVLIWDFDGTLYKMTPLIATAVKEADYKVVMNHTGWSKEKTIEEFNKVYMVKTPSSTKTASILSNISLLDAAIECETYKDRKPHLGPDPRLSEMFLKLSFYKHYILANGVKDRVLSALTILGVSSVQFEEIVTAQIVGVNKPDTKGFEYIMEKSGLPAVAHLMIGDREAVDLAPAKMLGMKTCLVWADGASTVADVTLKTVYEVATILV